MTVTVTVTVTVTTNVKEGSSLIKDSRGMFGIDRGSKRYSISSKWPCPTHFFGINFPFDEFIITVIQGRISKWGEKQTFLRQTKIPAPSVGPALGFWAKEGWNWSFFFL
jgi:hypothetical protein